MQGFKSVKNESADPEQGFNWTDDEMKIYHFISIAIHIM